MQKKKYLFGLAVLMVSLVGILGSRPEARAANTSCTCGTGSWPSYTYIGAAADFPTEDECNQECADRAATVYCYNGPCINPSAVTKTAKVATENTAKWCCVDSAPTPAVCTKINYGGTCDSYETLVQQTCDSYTSYCGWCCEDTSTKKCDSISSGGTCSGGATVHQKICSEVSSCQSSGYTITSNSGVGVGTTAASGAGTSTTTTFINPITSTSIDQVLTSLLTALSGLVVTLAVIFIVLGGILYMMSAGDPGMIKRAKDCWLFSIIGLAIVVAAPTFLKQVIEILGGSSTLNTTSISSALTVSQIATNVLNFLLSIVGIIAIISLVIAGGMYMTAYGDDTRIGTAKKMATYSIIGIAVALISLIAVQQVAKLITG